jgi:hypothetical protein
MDTKINNGLSSESSDLPSVGAAMSAVGGVTQAFALCPTVRSLKTCGKLSNVNAQLLCVLFKICEQMSKVEDDNHEKRWSKDEQRQIMLWCMATVVMAGTVGTRFMQLPRAMLQRV